MIARDIDQLRNAPAFGVTAIEGLLSVESMLHEAIRFVPYCEEHKQVWSPHFAQIILEAASQVDSIWKSTTKIDYPTAAKKVDIEFYLAKFGSLVARQRVVFFAGVMPCTIWPFECWVNPKPKASKVSNAPNWWQAYNDIKHDRFANQDKATLEHAVNAIAALFLSILYSGKCDMAIIATSLLEPTNYNPWAFTPTGELRDITFDCRAHLETTLFAHPIGIFGVDNCNLSGYWPGGSARFNIWWALNYEKFTKAQPPAQPPPA